MKKLLTLIMICLISASVNFVYAKQSTDQENLNTQLLEASKKGNLEEVKKLIAQGADVNYKDYNCGKGHVYIKGFSILIDAVEAGKKEVVEVLLNNKADIDMEINNGDGSCITALRAAIGKNDTAIIDLLLKYGSSDIVVALGRPDLLQTLILNGANINSPQKDLYDYTILAYAKKQGNKKLAQFFIDNGATNLDTPQDKEGENGFSHPWDNINAQLVVASKTGDLQLVKKLIQYGADVNAENMAALSYAKDPRIIQILKKAGAKYTLFDSKNNYASLREMEKRIQEGADLNATNENGETALLLAAKKGDSKTVRLLINSGADINIRKYGGKTALDLAIENGHSQVVKILLDSENNVNVLKSSDNSPLFVAAEKNYIEIVKLLLDAGINVNTKGKNGETAISYAVRHNNIEIVKILLNAGADVNTTYKIPSEYTEKYTILLHAVKEGQIEMSKLLIEAGADVNSQSEYKNTALIYASMEGNIEIVKLLLAAGADVNLQNKYGNTAISIIPKGERPEIVELLKSYGAKE